MVRNYDAADYPQIEALYKQSELYGGQFDEARDSSERLSVLTNQKPDAILVAEEDGKIVGTVTLFEDGRSAWLYRFAVADSSQSTEIAEQLYIKAASILKSKGHSQVLVYAPADSKHFEDRYVELGFSKGNDFTAYWRNLS